ncbi:hypothetical protein [Novosphingobium sp. PhB55]|uniref:carph-isopro domain-containing protein n=1 Tax=Novosphingobium sp. PhB55 TaxID=2485106 RepID=UPI00141705C6|nr:hypothetical protein [Novosphingobium sp. PhB55]
MNTVAEILESLGGVSAVSKETGIPITTVHTWKRTGFIPSWRIPALVKMARRLRKPLKEANFPVRQAAA